MESPHPAQIPHFESIRQDSSSILQGSTSSSSNRMLQAATDWLSSSEFSLLPQPAFAETDMAPSPPTNSEITLLRQAFSTFYGANRDAEAAEPLLTQVIQAWERQSADEKAGLYRVRGDCYAALLQADKAIADYSTAIDLLKSPGGEKADPAELPASLLGRARAIRSLSTKATKDQASQGAKDYEEALILSSREEWDTKQELLEDGARTNPYAAWEYGMALRLAGNTEKAKDVHLLASQFFEDIGDPARSVISLMDAGIDNADYDPEAGAKLIRSSFKKIKLVEGRDIPLLQRVIAKEGESRVALAGLYWTGAGDKQDAESQLGLACERLDQLEADAIARQKINPPVVQAARMKFNIDDIPGALDISCSRLRNKEYLNDRLEWPASLQQRVNKLYALKSK